MCTWLQLHNHDMAPCSTFVGSDPDFFGHLRHQGQAVQGRLVNAAHLVVHKQAGKQDRQGEYLRAVLSSLWLLGFGEFLVLRRVLFSKKGCFPPCF